VFALQFAMVGFLEIGRAVDFVGVSPKAHHMLLRGNGCADPLYALAASSCGATSMAICSERHSMVPLLPTSIFTDVDFGEPNE
jgi:hypothetical protein